MTRYLDIRLPLLFVLCLSLLASTVQAQGVTAENVGTAIKRAYDLSQQANDVAAYAELINLCEEIAKLPVEEKQVTYAKNLAAWAYNRRGEAHAEQANILAEKGNEDQAAELDAISLADFTRSVTLDPTKWKAYHNRGVSNALAGNYEAALVDFSRSLELQPEYSNTWFNRGEVYFEQGEFPQAIADYTKALQFKQNDLQALSRRGRAHAAARQYAEAIVDLTSVLRLAPSDAETLADRAEAYASLQQWQQAATDYRQAINLNDKLGRAYRGAAWLLSTSPNEQFRNPEMALQAARKAIELDGRTDHRYLDALSAALATSGEYSQAVTEMKAAIAAAPAAARPELEQRLKLYEAEQPYRQPK